MKWKAVHVFLHQKEDQDAFLIEVVDYFISQYQEEINCWFFIRYWDGGPHIRIRLKTNEEVWINFLSCINKWLKQKSFMQNLTKELFYKNNTFDGVPIEAEKLQWFENGEYLEFEYEPELERYGGTSIIKYSEEIFKISSELNLYILHILNKQKKNLSFPISIKFMDILVSTLDSDPKSFYKKASNYWERFDTGVKIERQQIIEMKNLSRKINFGKTLLNNLETNLYVMKKMISNEIYYESIILSLCHMNYNRAFIVPGYEYKIYYNCHLIEIEK